MFRPNKYNKGDKVTIELTKVAAECLNKQHTGTSCFPTININDITNHDPAKPVEKWLTIVWDKKADALYGEISSERHYSANQGCMVHWVSLVWKDGDLAKSPELENYPNQNK